VFKQCTGMTPGAFRAVQIAGSEKVSHEVTASVVRTRQY
jgi:hypothetical protein